MVMAATDVVARWVDRTGKPHRASLPDQGGTILLSGVRVLRGADVNAGRPYAQVDAQDIVFQFRDNETKSLWAVKMRPFAGAGPLALDAGMPELVR